MAELESGGVDLRWVRAMLRWRMEEVGYGRYKREERRERGREKDGTVISSSAQRRNVKSEQSKDR
jgi:hypothetical protein